MKAIIYTRVSTEEQAESGLGMEAQEFAAKQCAERMKAEIGGIHREPGVSGSLGLSDRPVLMEAISALEKGDILVVAKRDRIGRLDPMDMAIIEQAVRRNGARIISAAGEGTESDSPSDILMRRMMDVLAEYERLVIGARTKAALHAKKRRGEVVGLAPFGWDVADESGKLVPNEAEQNWIDRMLMMRRDGVSFQGIADTLNTAGVKKKHTGKKKGNIVIGQIWTKKDVYNLLLRAAERRAA